MTLTVSLWSFRFATTDGRSAWRHEGDYDPADVPVHKQRLALKYPAAKIVSTKPAETCKGV